MTTDNTDGTGTPDAAKLAADKLAADKVVADKAAADKVAADKLAADNVAAGKNPDGSPKEPAKDSKPVVPEKYEIKLPEKSPFGETDLVGFSAEAKALGLTNDQAQKLVDERVGLIATTSAKYLEEAKADKDLGGAKWTETETLAKSGLDAFLKDHPADEQAMIKGWFDRTGLGNHKALVRGFARLGRLMAEDKPLGSGKATDGKSGDKRDPADVLYGKK